MKKYTKAIVFIVSFFLLSVIFLQNIEQEVGAEIVGTSTTTCRGRPALPAEKCVPGMTCSITTGNGAGTCSNVAQNECNNLCRAKGGECVFGVISGITGATWYCPCDNTNCLGCLKYNGPGGYCKLKDGTPNQCVSGNWLTNQCPGTADYQCCLRVGTSPSTTSPGGGPQTTSPGGGSTATTPSAPSTACTPRCSNKYIHARVFFTGSGCTTLDHYGLDCSCTGDGVTTATVSSSDPTYTQVTKITNEWSCACQKNNNSWTPITNSGGNYCCGGPQDNGSTTCTPQSPAKYAGASQDSCFNFGPPSSTPSQCFPGGGSSWCCYKADTGPITGAFSRCSDKYKYCFSSWTTDSSGLDTRTPRDTPTTDSFGGYATDCACDASNIPEVTSSSPIYSTGKCLPSACGSTTPPPACGTACITPADCTTARDGCTTCVNNVCAVPPPACNTPCTGSPDCVARNAGCDYCNASGVCVATPPATNPPATNPPATNPPATTVPPPACGNPCTTPAQCNGAQGGCTACPNGVCAIPPACGTPCNTPPDCNGAINGCTTCINNVCTAPPACGTACTTPADCASSRDICTGCNIVDNICAPASCTCDGITYSGLMSGEMVTITSNSKIVGNDNNDAKVTFEKFYMTEGDTTTGTIIKQSDKIPSTVVKASLKSSPLVVKYQTQWVFKLPELKKGKTYRIWSDIVCEPKASATSYNILPKIAVLGAEIKASFWDNVLSLFGNFANNIIDSLGSGSTVKKTIQLETFKPATVIEKKCSTIIFRQD